MRDDHPAPWWPVVSQVNIINVHVIINTKCYSLLINAYIKDSVQGYSQGLRSFEAAVSVLLFLALAHRPGLKKIQGCLGPLVHRPGLKKILRPPSQSLGGHIDSYL